MIDPTATLARDLVLKYGWNSTCFQIVNPGIERWFSPRGDAVVGYVVRKGVRVVAGAPVCSDERLEAIVANWEAETTKAGQSICYFGAEGRMRSLLLDRPGYSTVSLGAQPNWNPQNWSDIFDADRNLRAQRNRALNKEVHVSEWTIDQTTNNPRLLACLQEWLTTRGLPPMHFLVEPETLGFVFGRRIFVAERHGRVVGFLVLSPVPNRNGWLTEQFPRALDAPNGTVELLMDFAIRQVARSGAEYLTMGIVPLSLHGVNPSVSNPTWLQFIANWVRAHGKRFYNFDGLDRFKSKFHPEQWEPIYVISKEDTFSLRTLIAIAAAFSDGPPSYALARGFGRAFKQELRWLGRPKTWKKRH